MKKTILLISSIILMTACTSKKENVSTELNSGINKADMDTTAVPSQDFFRYACGGWMDNNPLPAEYGRYGSFDQLAQNNKLQLRELIEGIAATEHEVGTNGQKIADFYNSGMDTVAIEAQGTEAIVADWDKVYAMTSLQELPALLAQTHIAGLSPLFGLFPQAHPENSSLNIAWIWQSGLGIGDRDYYLEEENENIRQEYVKYMTTLFQNSNYEKLTALTTEQIQNILALETALANVFYTKEALRDPFLSTNIMSIEEFQALIPSFNVAEYLKSSNIETDIVNVGQVDYIKGLEEILKATPLETIQNYLAWNLFDAAAPYLGSTFVDANFAFYGTTLSGTEVNQPRWKRVLGTVDGSLGEVVGQMYVEKHFPAEAKNRMVHLVENVKVAMSERMNNLEWMCDSTKAKAIDKLNGMIVKIGYPDTWKDYTNLTVSNNNYYNNVVNARKFSSEEQLAKIGKPVDPTEWLMSPQTVNAYYNPTTNEICFPAGILQPPFFRLDADDAVNYGAIGVVIAHEMTHGFDDQGRNYDKQGNLKNWWSEEDAEQFNTRTKVLVDYFDNIIVIDTMHANGTFTLGENIADNGGLNISYTALQKAITQGGVKGEMDGFTPEQRFFIAYSQVWANNIRDEEIRLRTKTDPHSLGKWRVNGTLPHVTPFIDAFGIKEGDPMFVAPENRAQIW